MTFLPIVVRELRVAARRNRTYAARFATILGVVGFGCYNMLIFSAMLGTMRGAMMFSWVVWLAFLICLVLATNTVDCISEEKREGTLGFLFLTDLRGYDVALGKLFSRSLVSFYSLLGILPVVAICMLLGGVTFAEFWQAALGLMNIFFFSQSVGIFVSAICWKRRTAAAAAGAILGWFTLGFVGLAALADYWGHHSLSSLFGWLNLGYCIYWAGNGGAAVAGPLAARFSNYWNSFLFIHLSAWAFLALASWWIPRSWEEKAPAPNIGLKNRLLRNFHKRFTPRQPLLDRNPFLWLCVRDSLGSIKVWIALLLINGFWVWLLTRNRFDDAGLPIFVGAILSNHLLLKIIVASDASASLEEHRHSGALEYLLCCTPLTTEDIIGGQWMAVRRALIRPLLAVLASDIIMSLYIISRRSPQYSDGDKGNFVLFVLATVVMLIADIIALGWIAMRSAMTQRKPRHAAGRALAQVIILPGALLFFLFALMAFARVPIFNSFASVVFVWFGIGICVDLLAGNFARAKLLDEFRARASAPLEDDSGLLGRLGRLLGHAVPRWGAWRNV